MDKKPSTLSKENPLKIDVNNLLFILAASFLVRIYPLFNAVNWTDFYVQQAIPILKHLNIYSATHRIFPYSPVSMFLPAFCAELSLIFKAPFYIIIRFPAIIADVCIAVSIYVTLIRMGRKNAYEMGLLYALNPVSILICSFHGNMISIPVLFSFLAYTVLLAGDKENYRLSALLLAAAIGFRGYPILMLPLFLLKMKISLSKKVEYIIYSTIPVALSFVPFLFLDYKSVLREVFAYSGFPDYGLAAIIRAIYSFMHNRPLEISSHLVAILSATSKILFLAVYIMLLLLSARKQLITSVLIVFLAFYFIYTSVSSQYFMWILPFCFLAQDKMLKYYLFFVTWALVNYYWIHFPFLIFGKLGLIKAPINILLAGATGSLSLLWLFCLLWAIKLLVKNGGQCDLL